MYGLTISQLTSLRNVFRLFPQVEDAVLYGSRARGDYKPYSDLDITLYGKNISLTQLAQMEAMIDDLLLPYNCDLSAFHSLKNTDLIHSIEREGKSLLNN